jgi:hypothetical protein
MPEQDMIRDAKAAVNASREHLLTCKGLLIRVRHMVKDNPTDALRSHLKDCLDTAIDELAAAEEIVAGEPFLALNGGHGHV